MMVLKKGDPPEKAERPSGQIKPPRLRQSYVREVLFRHHFLIGTIATLPP